jgi:broad specificity phosphatase PhoE
MVSMLVFVRHGHSQANVAGVFANRGDGYPLTDTGRVQAGELADRLADLPVDRVYSSPLLRARQTAEVITARTGAPVTVTAALTECDMGELEGTGDPAGWALHARVNDAWLHGHPEARPPGGESLLDVRARFAPLIDTLATESADRCCVLVGHGSLYRAVLPWLLAGVDHAFTAAHALGYTDMVIAEYRGCGFTCISWAGLPTDPAPWSCSGGPPDHEQGCSRSGVYTYIP